jgi:carbamoylphosphate synthase large subunit
MYRSVLKFFAAGLLAISLPAVSAHAALDRMQFEATLVTARDYADDRSLLFYCLRGAGETVPFLYAGLQADLEQAVQRMKAAGASARQNAEMVQVVLSAVRFYPRDAKDDALDRRCISKDVERSRAEVKGVGLPLFLRPPFDKFGK